MFEKVMTRTEAMRKEQSGNKLEHLCTYNHMPNKKLKRGQSIK